MAVDILTASKLKKMSEGTHSDGRGLYFFVRGDSRTWSLRYTAGGRRREMSLGVYPDVGLAEARQRRDEARQALSAGTDPQAARKQAEERTLAVLAEQAFEAIKGDLKNEGKAGRWKSPLKTHILPTLGGVDVTTLTARQVRDVLAPIWRTKTSASAKALDRLGIVMRHAAAAYPGEVDLEVVPSAKVLLGSQGHTVTHIPAMPWAEVPTFYATLGNTPTELAMRLLILTASRSAPIRFAHVDQFDGETWVIPGANMKFRKSKQRQVAPDFRIPLSDEAQRVVELARPLARDGFLFCAHKGKPISDAAMAKFLDREGLPYRPHGFRSSFREWATKTKQNWMIAELSLAHLVGNKTERSYERADLLEERRPLMQEWSDHVSG